MTHRPLTRACSPGFRPRATLVYDYGGPPLQYVLPAWQSRAELTVYVPRPERLGGREQAELTACGADVRLDTARWDRREVNATAERITAVAAATSADAIVTFSELFSIPTAAAAEALGLRGASVGGAERARDKLLMRAALARAGLDRPGARAVRDVDELRRAVGAAGGPVVLKPRRGMSAAGVHRLDGEDDVARAWEAGLRALDDFDVPDAEQGFLVEDLLVGDPGRWYVRVDGLSDQVSVEGLVVEGRYVPLALTDVTPKVPPFTQSGHLSPTSLPPWGRRAVLRAARRAVDALGLSTCGTHVELKLMPDGECAVVEIAARYAGRTIIPQTDHAYGLDLVGALADALLSGARPERAYDPDAEPDRAAATLYLYASEYLNGHPAGAAYPGLTPPAALVPPGVRVAGWVERPRGWPLTPREHEQPHWLAQLYLEGTDLDAVRAGVGRVRDAARLQAPAPAR
jgi:L-alanine-L-anticapsin ligase